MIVIDDKVEFKKLIAEAVREELKDLQLSAKVDPIKISEELLNIKQLQLLLKISKPTIYKLIKNKKLPIRRAGRRLLFPKSEVLIALNKESQTNKIIK